jgi:hypothetical protein
MDTSPSLLDWGEEKNGLADEFKEGQLYLNNSLIKQGLA